MPSRSNDQGKDMGLKNKRVEIPLMQRSDKSYGIANDLQPIKVTASKRAAPMKSAPKQKAKVNLKIDEYKLKSGKRWE